MRGTLSGYRRRLILAVVGLVAAGALLVPAACKRRPSGRVHSETIGSLGTGYRRNSLAVSRDHRRLAWVQARGSRCRIVLDGKPGPTFAKCADPVFSPDGKTVAYWAAARETEPPSVQLAVDGVAGDVVASDQGPIAFAAAGARWSAIAPTRPGATGRLVAFDRQRVLGEYADTSKPVISPDGTHVAYLAVDASGQQTLVVDGVAARSFGTPQVAVLPALKKTRTGPNLEPEALVRYLADGTLAGVALGEQGWTVFHDQEVWATYPGLRMPPDVGFEVTQSDLLASPAILAGSFVTAESAAVACWWEKLGGEPERWRVACNGKPVDANLCDAPSTGLPIAVSGDGRAVLYVCQVTPPSVDLATPADPRHLWVVAAGERRGPHRFVWGLDLSADGAAFAYAAADSIDGTWFYVVDDRRHDGPWQHAFPPKLAPDGASVIWAASPDPKGLRVDLVQDGRVRSRAEVVMAPPLFLDDGRVQWAVKRGNSVRRVIFD